MNLMNLFARPRPTNAQSSLLRSSGLTTVVLAAATVPCLTRNAPAQPTFSISGTPAYVTASGATHVLTIAQHTWTTSHSMTLGPNRFLSFDVGATNTGGTNFELGLSNFVLRTDQPVESIALTFSQDFERAPGNPWLGLHAVEGSLAFSPGATGFLSVTKTCTHESTNLPLLTGTWNSPGMFSIGQGAQTVVPAIGAAYSIVSAIQLTLTSSGDWTEVRLTQGTTKSASVPAPSGLVAASVACAWVARRRRRHA